MSGSFATWAFYFFAAEFPAPMADQQQTASQPTGRPGLHRALGFRMAIAVVVGNVIGSGIFLKPGVIAADGQQFGLIIAVWIFGGVLCILGALCFAELATMLPRAGGMYVYLREAYGRPLAFLFGWSEFLFNRPASIAALGVAFAGTLSLGIGTLLSGSPERAGATGPLLNDVLVVLVAVVLIVAMAWVNIIGVLWGGRVQLVTTIFKAGGLALVALAPLLLIPFTAEGFDPANYGTVLSPPAGQTPTPLAVRIGAVLLAVMWAYNGWHGITPLAEEVRRPRRNIPLALFGGIGVLIVLYVAANFAYHGVLTMQQMSTAGEKASEAMLDRLLGRTGVAMMSSIIMCSTFGAINTNLLHAPRVTFAMGRDGVFFRALGRVHAQYRTPAAAIFVSAAMAIALVITVAVAKQAVRGVDVDKLLAQPSTATATDGDGEMDGETYGDRQAVSSRPPARSLPRMILQSLQNGTMFNLLTNFVIFSASIFYTLAVLAVIVLRVRRPDLKRSYRTWGYPVVPVLFIAVYLWFLSRIYLDYPLESLTGLVLIALGLPVYFMYQYSSKRDRNERD